jgi:Icc protein
MAAKHKSIETKWYEQRDKVMQAVKHLDRRDFFKVMGASAAAILGKGLLPPHSFQLVEVAHAQSPKPEKFTFAYVSDSHLYSPKINDTFIRAAIRAVDDVNRLDPQPDFVLFGGDLAQLGAKEELEIGRPVRMMVGEHDWFLDMGQTWQDFFGMPTYSFDHKGVHFVVLMSVMEKDFWTARGMSPEERMHTVAGLDNGVQSRFEVGAEQRKWLADDLKKVSRTTPIVVFSHSPLYKYYKPWNFWTDDADEVQAILRPYQTVTVVHGHTHQVLSNRIGNINFHGLLSTAWPWPYAPEGLPKLTVAMDRANPFDPNDGCGDGHLNVGADGLVDMVYNLWERNPMTVSASYLKSGGRTNPPAATTLKTY